MARKYFTLPFITIRGRGDAPPPRSPDGQARLYFDEDTGTLLISKNGAEWEALGPQGDAAFVVVQQDGYDTVIGPDTLNFTGMVTISDAGGGVATISIPTVPVESQVSIAVNSSSFYTGYTLAGGAAIDADAWDTITWSTAGVISRAGIALEVILKNSATDAVLATHTYTSTTTSVDSTVLALSGQVTLEAQHRLTGVIVDGDIGTLLSGRLILQRG